MAQPTSPGAQVTSTLSTSSTLLSWSDNSTDETGFQIERSLSESSGFVLITTTAMGLHLVRNNFIGYGQSTEPVIQAIPMLFPAPRGYADF
jgi:hypothetical protein